MRKTKWRKKINVKDLTERKSERTAQKIKK